MKIGLLIAMMLLCIAASVSAEPVAEVLLRFSKQDTAMKIVLESDENVIRNSDVVISASGARISFLSPYALKKPEDFVFKTLRDARTLTIIFTEVSEVRTYKLSTPARIVMEMKLKSLDSGPRQQAQNEAPKQPAQKVNESGNAQVKALKFNTVVIDPGHGGYDYGINREAIKEKEISLSIARDLANSLQKKGLKVFLTRKADQSFPLVERINFSNSKSPDLFISVHATPTDKFVITTATADESSGDATIMLYKLSVRQNRHLDMSKAAARALANALQNEYKTEPVLRELPLPILASMDAAAVLLEYPLTARNTYDQKERERLISAIIKGFAGNE